MSARSRSTRIRRIAAIAAGIGLVVAGVGITAVNEQSAKAAAAAAVLDGFDPANIIDDAVMFNGSTMTASEIQTFLNGKQPTCASGATCLRTVKVDMPAMTANPMCKAIAAKKSQTAAQVIAAVGRACNVNPQVILVMLQKEQTLVTGRTPYSGETVSLIYRKATGLGCPDTAACDPAKYGLFNQLYGVAYWLVRYTTPPGTTGSGWTNYNWFPVGRTNGVLYHPNAACGAKAITIKNKATASLYYYTPYQPNAASLAAGWGLGNGCSSYGNRNFFLYFTTWFGSTHTVVTGAINTYWTAHKSTYGNPTGNAVTITANGGGTSQTFQKGTIYTSPAGSVGVAGSVLTKYNALGGPGGNLGWPRRAAVNRTGTNGGTAQAFQKGTVYVSTAGTAAVLAPIYSTFGANGYELGSLGWPAGDAVTSSAHGGATWQAFQGGRVVVASGKATTVTGKVLAIWKARSYEAGSLGWPTGNATTLTVAGKKGVLQSFQTGVVTVTNTAYTVTGSVGKNYLSAGGPTGYLRWPISANAQQSAGGGGWIQQFSNGIVSSNAKAGVHGISNSPTLTRYLGLKGPAGVLGWLKSNTKVSGGKVAAFTGGNIYASSKGAFSMTGPILTKYLQKKGQAGVLGWPTSQPVVKNGTTTQTFQHGRITWTKSGGAKASRT
ncbi:hypothetical protein [Amnibacterium kyonggiense]|nr:hypothetical protein [Amnibacterium kyonggiense]